MPSLSGFTPGTAARKRQQRAAGEPQEASTGAARLPVEEEDLTCAICCDVLLDPCVGPCGHDFCWTCLESWRRATADRGTLKCPACRQKIPLDGTTLGVCQRLKRVVEALCPEAVARRRLELQVASEVAVAAATTVEVQDDATPPIPQAPRQRLQMPSRNMSHDDASLHMLTQLSAHAAAPSMAPSYPSPGTCPTTGMEHTVAPSDAFIGAMPATTRTVDISLFATALDAVRPMQATAAHNFPTTGPNAMTAAHGTWLQNVPPRQPWHDAAADLDARLACAKGLIALMRAWGIGAHDASALLRAVRGLEVLLYRVAPSRQVHADPSSLQGRIKDLMHLRAVSGSGALI